MRLSSAAIVAYLPYWLAYGFHLYPSQIKKIVKNVNRNRLQSAELQLDESPWKFCLRPHVHQLLSIYTEARVSGLEKCQYLWSKVPEDIRKSLKQYEKLQQEIWKEGHTFIEKSQFDESSLKWLEAQNAIKIEEFNGTHCTYIKHMYWREVNLVNALFNLKVDTFNTIKLMVWRRRMKSILHHPISSSRSSASLSKHCANLFLL